jgi:transcriptional regulator with XRE-family HTH domain
MTVNQRIKYALYTKGKSYIELGERLGIKSAAISNRINRDREIDDPIFIKAVADLTGLSFDWIMYGGEEDEKIKDIPYILLEPEENKPGKTYKELYEDMAEKFVHASQDLSNVIVEIAELRGKVDKLENENAWLRGLIEKNVGPKN